MAHVENVAEGRTVAAVPLRTADKRLSNVFHDLIHSGGAAGGRQRRNEQRFPYPQLIRMAPVGSDGRSPLGESIVVVGKHLSARGIDFYHREPLPHRRMIAWLETKGGQTHTVLIELLWCRFTSKGWYDNGGRLLKVVDLPPSVDHATTLPFERAAS